MALAIRLYLSGWGTMSANFNGQTPPNIARILKFLREAITEDDDDELSLGDFLFF